MNEKKEKLVEVKNLCVNFKISSKDTLYAVNNVSLDIFKGETLGLVGESGCGKTTLGRAIKNIYKATSGETIFENKNIYKLSPRELKAYSKDVQMIFQDPYSSLDPRMTVREIIKEGMRAHNMYPNTVMNEKTNELLELVGLSKEQANRFPHEFSGGQRQRIGIARALAVNPKFIVCDEPTSALDVSVQAQVIALLKELQSRFALTYMFISHDLAMVKYVSDRIAVMYLGEIIEIAPSSTLYKNPMHPYTKSLLSAIQIPDPEIEKNRKRIKITGDLKSPVNISPIGCKFEPRCPCATDKCKSITPTLAQVDGEHYSACVLGKEL